MTFKEIRESLIGKEMYIRYEDGDRKVYSIADVKRDDGKHSTKCSRVEFNTIEIYDTNTYQVFTNKTLGRLIQGEIPYIDSYRVFALTKKGIDKYVRDCRRAKLCKEREQELVLMKEKFNSVDWDWYDFLATLAFFVKDDRSFDKAIIKAAAFTQHYKDHYAYQLAGNLKDSDKILNQNLVKK